MKKMDVKTITGIGTLMGIIIVLQYFFGSQIKIGVFSITLALIPIVIGAILYGPYAGAFLGFVFGLVVLLSGDAAVFLAISIPATIFTVILKGSLAGYISGLLYKTFNSKHVLSTFISALACPIVNTATFLLCCLLFFMPTITMWANAEGFTNVGLYLVVFFVGMNFLVELLINILLTPAIVAIIKRIKEMD